MTKTLAQVATQTSTRVLAKAQDVATRQAPAVDSFHHGVRVRAGGAEAHVTPRATGGSVQLGADTFGASVRLVDGAATLGAIAVKAGKRELSVGLTPAAPAPLPMPVYAGSVREE